MWSEQEIIPVVNKQDEIIGHKKRGDITYDDIYRVSACRIIDPAWNILLTQRWLTKKHNPWKWQPAVAGTVKQGESYLQNILHEIEEEVGIQAQEKDLMIWQKVFRNPDWQYFVQWYVMVYAGDKSLLRPEQWSVEQLKWFTPHELEDALEKTPDLFLGGVHSMFQYMKK